MKTLSYPNTKSAKSIQENFDIVFRAPAMLRIKKQQWFEDERSYIKFIVKVFSIPSVVGIRANPLTKSILIRYNYGGIDDEDTLISALEDNSVGRRTTGVPPPRFYTHPISKTDKINLVRCGDLVTDWKTVCDLPGRLRLRSELLYRRKTLSMILEDRIKDFNGIRNCKASSITGSILIVYDRNKLTKEDMVAAIEEIVQTIPEEKIKREKSTLDRITYTSFVLGSTITIKRLFPLFTSLTTPTIIFKGLRIFRKAISAIQRKKVKVDLLDTLILSLCLATGKSVAAAFMVWILDVANALLELTSQRSKNLLTQAFGKRQKFVRVLFNGREIEKSLAKVEVGDVIVAETGEEIQLDGSVYEGEGLLDQHILTGESAPVEKKAGDSVFASTLVLGGRLYIKVDKTVGNTVKAKILKILEETSQYKPKILGMGEDFADKMVMPTLVLGALGFAARGPSSGMAIINSDYGTGIRVAAPMALLTSLAIAMRNNILIKKGGCLETLTDVDIFLFDKTGTLTDETPELTEIILINGGYSEKRIIRYAATIEQHFTHPIARAILKKAREMKVAPLRPDLSQYQIGLGIRAVVDGKTVRIGSARYMESEKIDIPVLVRKKMETYNARGGSLILLAVNDSLESALVLEPKIRYKVREVIDKLKKRGKEVILISGDHNGPTRFLAGQLGIDKYFSEMLPQEKAEFVKGFQGQGKKVAMVGDGVNDSLALSFSDVSISLRGASDIATDTADIVLMDGSLTKLDLLYDISEKFQERLEQIFYYMIVLPNTVSILGAFFGVIGLRASLFLNNLFSCIAALYAILPLMASGGKTNT